MEDEREDGRAPSGDDPGRGASPPKGAHERAVMTVRLTLLLLIIGVALFLFGVPAGAFSAGALHGDSVARAR